MEEIAVGGDGDATELRVRTRMNVETADVTLVLQHSGVIRDEGTEYTIACVEERAERTGEDSANYLIKADLAEMQQGAARETFRAALDKILNEKAKAAKKCFATSVPVVTLNVAGPRQTMLDGPDVYAAAHGLLLEVLEPERRPFRVASQDRAAIIEQGCQNLRHWDTVRWLAPFFFFTLVGGVISGITSITGEVGFIVICFGLVLLGCLALLLIYKTVRYHIIQVKTLVQLGLDPKSLPMLGFNWFWTATNWFSLAIVGTMLLLIVAAFAGPEATFTLLDFDHQSEIKPQIGCDVCGPMRPQSLSEHFSGNMDSR